MPVTMGSEWRMQTDSASRGQKRIRRAERHEPSGTSFLYRQADACRSPILSITTAWVLNHFPARAIILVDQLRSFRHVRNDELLSIPVKSFAESIGHVAQEDRFGQRTGVVKVAGGR